MVRQLVLRQEQSQGGKLKYIGMEFLCNQEIPAPPFSFVGVYREGGEMLLSFYVDKNLCGPYWPDENNTMRPMFEFKQIDFKGKAQTSVYRILREMAKRAEECSEPSDP